MKKFQTANPFNSFSLINKICTQEGIFKKEVKKTEVLIFAQCLVSLDLLARGLESFVTYTSTSLLNYLFCCAKNEWTHIHVLDEDRLSRGVHVWDLMLPYSGVSLPVRITELSKAYILPFFLILITSIIAIRIVREANVWPLNFPQGKCYFIVAKRHIIYSPFNQITCFSCSQEKES